MHDAECQDGHRRDPRSAGPIELDFVAQAECGEHRQRHQNSALNKAPCAPPVDRIILPGNARRRTAEQNRHRRDTGGSQQHHGGGDQLVQREPGAFGQAARGLNAKEAHSWWAFQKMTGENTANASAAAP